MEVETFIEVSRDLAQELLLRWKGNRRGWLYYKPREKRWEAPTVVISEESPGPGWIKAVTPPLDPEWGEERLEKLLAWSLRRIPIW